MIRARVLAGVGGLASISPLQKCRIMPSRRVKTLNAGRPFSATGDRAVTALVAVPCARCGGSVAKFSFLPPSVQRDPPRYRLQRTGFMGQVTKFGPTDELRRLLEAIRAADYVAARRFDMDLVAFHCRQCGESYCERCWRIGPPAFDEGFYDCTSAVCPQGHEQIVDD